MRQFITSVVALKRAPTIMASSKHIGGLSSGRSPSIQRGNRAPQPSIERQRLEDELRQGEERFRLAARASDDVIWDWNLVTNEGWRNDTFQTRFGYTAGQLKIATESWYGGIHPLDKDRVVAGIHAAIDSDLETWSDEYRFYRADKSLAFVFDRGYIVRDEKRKASRMLGVMMDISERRQAEER